MAVTSAPAGDTPTPNTALRKFVAVLAVVIASLPLQAYVLATLWRWFVVPALDAPPLTLYNAAGLFLIVRFLVATRGPEKQSTVSWALGAFLWPVFILAVGGALRAFAGQL